MRIHCRAARRGRAANTSVDPERSVRPMSSGHLAVTLLALLSCTRVCVAQVARSDFDITDGAIYAEVLSGSTLYIGGDFHFVGQHVGGGVPIDRSSAAPLRASPEVVGAVVVALPDGSGGWFIGGNFTTVGGLPRSNLAHILADYSVSSWDPHPNSEVDALAVVGNIVYAGGFFSTIGGQSRRSVAAIDATTGLATSWDPNPGDDNAPYIYAYINALAVIGTTVYVGGEFNSIGGQRRNYIAALNATTGLASSQDPNASAVVHALAVSGNTVFVGGQFLSIGGQPRSKLAALNATTGLANAWDPRANDQVNALAVSGTTVIAGGLFTSVGGQARNNIAALDASTGVPAAWDADANAPVNAVTIDEGSVYVGGEFTSIGGQKRNMLAALDFATGLATPWDPSVNAPVLALAVNGGTVYAGGGFTIMGGKARNHVAALDVTTGHVTGWDPNAYNSVYALAASGTTIYAGGSFLNIGGQPRNYIAALDAASGLATAWNPSAIDQVNCLAVNGATVYAGGWFYNIGGQPRMHIAALDSSTGLVTDWNPNADGLVYSIALSGSTVYTGGDFTNIGGQARRRIAALDAATGLATAWDPSVPDYSHAYLPVVNVLTVSGQTVYAGGSFATIGGKYRPNLAALDATTGLATDWDPNMNLSGFDMVECVAASGPTIYVGGLFTQAGGQPRQQVAALDAVTGHATGWVADANSWVHALVVSNSTVYAGGSFSWIGGYQRANLAAIVADLATPALPSLESEEAYPDRVQLTWVAADRLLTANVYRRTEVTPWVPLAKLSADGSGIIKFEDTHVTAGLRYGYRLGVLTGGAEEFVGETWVDVPSTSKFALSGLRPNPATKNLMAAFSLPNSEPAQLTLLDVSGRMVVAREVGELGAGSHVLDLMPGRTIAPGVYLLRLTGHGHSIVKRAVVIR